jgi:4-amino-4-deoxy-L-arabinose transferase-like glycosyltransferase
MIPSIAPAHRSVALSPARRLAVSLFAILLIWAGIYLPKLGRMELHGEEGRRILPGVTMLETGNWLVPYVGGKPYLRKPPMVNWLAAISFKATGSQDEWSARLPSVIAVLLLALGVYLSSRRWLGEDHALLAAIAVLSTVCLLDKGRLIEIEALYVACFGLGLVVWLGARGLWSRWILSALPLGFGLLLKGPLHLLFFYGIVVLILWRQRKLSELRSFAHLCAVVLMIAIFAAWAIPHLQTPEARTATREWSDQFTGRLALQEFHWKDWLLNYPRALSNFLPWLLFLPFGRGLEGRCFQRPGLEGVASNALSEGGSNQENEPFIFGLEFGSLITFLIVMLAPGALPRYTMPLLVPVCLLAACRIQRAPSLRQPWKYMLTGLTAFLLLASAVGFFFSHERVFIGFAVILCGANLFFLGPLRYRNPESETTTLSVGTGILTVVAIFFYADAILPRLPETLRKRAALIAQIVPPGEIIYAVDPGPQPLFFYLRKPWSCIADWNQLPLNAKYVLAGGRNEPGLIQRSGQNVQLLLNYRDRGEKEFSLFGIRSK